MTDKDSLNAYNMDFVVWKFQVDYCMYNGIYSHVC